MRGTEATLAAALLFALACGPGAPDAPGSDAGRDDGPPRRPDIVLIVVDTLRADHVGAYGYPRPTSPAIDALAADGTRFEDATAPSSWTRPSVASLFTSRLPSEHGAVSITAPLDPGVPSVVEALRDAGYRTVGVSGNFPHLSDASGLTRGFDTFASVAIAVGGAAAYRATGAENESSRDTLMRLPLLEDGGRLSLRAPTADEVNARVREVLPPPGDAPLFLYVHYMDPHSGYLAPEPLRALFADDAPGAAALPAATSDHVVELASGREALLPGERERLVDLYDAEIRAVDDGIRQLLADLAGRGYGDDAVVVLLSDHGEELGDHGGFFHGLTLHRELLRVPLVVRDGTGRLAPGVRSEPVELLDVPVTLLALAGVAPLPGMRGRSLVAPDGAPRERVAELHPDPVREEHAGRRRHAASITRWPWKVVVPRDGEPLLFRLDTDPDESTPRSPETPGAPAGLVDEATARAARVAATRSSRDVPESERAGLRALGYAE